MRYFARINGEQRGPFTLNELPEAGVGPKTYVWCKGMEKWERAEDVADICRFFRQRIFDLMHGAPATPAAEAPAQPDNDEEDIDPYENVPVRFRNIARREGIDPESFGPLNPEPDLSRQPFPLLSIAIIVTLFCFPLTGVVAIYYAYKTRKIWEEAGRSQAKNSKELYNNDERNRLRREAYECHRKAMMWTGITFFAGIILTGILSSRMFV
ncbi:MAG: GYF domain-containing protein [Muribaculaceae bacterium]|nr:GYF domain-containing protein [Muribaculaceae bacterium]